MRLRFRPRLATIVEEEDGEDDDDEDDVDDGDVEDVDDAVPGTVEHMPEEGPVASSTPDALRFVLQRCPKGTRPALVKALTRASLVPGSDDALVDLLWSGSRLPLPSSAFDGAPDLLVNQFPGLQRVMSRRDFIHHRLRAVRHLLPFLPDVVFLPQPNAAMFAKGSWKLYPVHSRRRASVMTAKSLSKATSGVAVAERNDVVGQVQAWAVVTSIVPLRVYVYHGEAISVPSSWSSIHTVVASVICSIVTPDMHRDGSFQVVRVTVKIGRDGRLWLADVQSGVPIRGRPAAQVVTDVVRFVVSHQRRRQQDRNPLFHRADTPADLLSAMRRLTIQAPAVHS
ncbi:Uncharacterized protein PBTT_02791 [Plasmodiophora brassicae]|nr:hypothetical protein PBRA_007077 [Plasmodiophora brassicae]